MPWVFALLQWHDWIVATEADGRVRFLTGLVLEMEPGTEADGVAAFAGVEPSRENGSDEHAPGVVDTDEKTDSAVGSYGTGHLSSAVGVGIVVEVVGVDYGCAAVGHGGWDEADRVVAVGVADMLVVGIVAVDVAGMLVEVEEEVLGF